MFTIPMPPTVAMMSHSAPLSVVNVPRVMVRPASSVTATSSRAAAMCATSSSMAPMMAIAVMYLPFHVALPLTREMAEEGG